MLSLSCGDQYPKFYLYLKDENVRLWGERSESDRDIMSCRFPNRFHSVFLSNHNFVVTHFEFLVQNSSNTLQSAKCTATACVLFTERCGNWSTVARQSQRGINKSLLPLPKGSDLSYRKQTCTPLFSTLESSYVNIRCIRSFASFLLRISSSVYAGIIQCLIFFLNNRQFLLNAYVVISITLCVYKFSIAIFV